MELVNTHAHTEFCGHGEGTVDELVQAARAAGITTLAVTEHYPLCLLYTAAPAPAACTSLWASSSNENWLRPPVSGSVTSAFLSFRR